MAHILNIETSTTVCSVALAAEGQVMVHHENYQGQTHATLLNAYVDDVMRYLRSRQIALDAVAVSIGPGSYTGLRIGLSHAKGIAFGLDIPLIAVNTLQLLAVSAMFNHQIDDEALYAPMIDARRMEVYNAVYTAALEEVVEPRPVVLTEGLFDHLLADHKLVFIGDGSNKARDVIKHDNAVFVQQVHPVALDMVALSERAFRLGSFADVAYCTPLYLKQFKATVPKNKVLSQISNNDNVSV